MVLEVYQLSRLASPDMSQALSYFWRECRQCCRARPLSFPGTILRLQSSDSVKRASGFDLVRNRVAKSERVSTVRHARSAIHNDRPDRKPSPPIFATDRILSIEARFRRKDTLNFS